ncbi:MAG: ABC transporter substrate-binding protein [Pseudorhodobacter sp.]|nr:ABC transporter substrate-binding protein [Pseudorhodobacter sp.]
MRHAVAALARRLIVAALGLALPTMAAPFQIEAERMFGPPQASARIEVLSTTDIAIFAPVIEGFLKRNPDLGVHYVVASSQEIHQAIGREGAAFDLVISSAMDLQMKLANDGLARAVPPDQIAATGAVLPDWAHWRDLVFAVAQEPVVLLIAPDALAGGLPVPHSRRDLIALLRDHPERFRGRIGTYDPVISGAGYLFAAQDARISDSFWRLAEVMGRLDLKLYCCSGDMIADIRAGRLLLAYNVLGSYALARQPTGGAAGGADTSAGKPEVIELEDFTLTLLRTALVPQTAPDPARGALLLGFLMSPEGQRLIGEAAGLPPIDAEAFAAHPHLRPIRLDPGLLAHLDRLTRSRFLGEWQAAMDQP